MLAQELRSPETKKFKKSKVYAMFKENIWAANLAEMGSLSSFTGGIKYLLCGSLFLPNIYSSWIY